MKTMLDYRKWSVEFSHRQEFAAKLKVSCWRAAEYLKMFSDSSRGQPLDKCLQMMTISIAMFPKTYLGLSVPQQQHSAIFLMFQSFGGKTSASDTLFVSDKDIGRKVCKVLTNATPTVSKDTVGVAEQNGNGLIEVVTEAEGWRLSKHSPQLKSHYGKSIKKNKKQKRGLETQTK